MWFESQSDDMKKCYALQMSLLFTDVRHTPTSLEWTRRTGGQGWGDCCINTFSTLSRPAGARSHTLSPILETRPRWHFTKSSALFPVRLILITPSRVSRVSSGGATCNDSRIQPQREQSKGAQIPEIKWFPAPPCRKAGLVHFVGGVAAYASPTFNALWVQQGEGRVCTQATVVDRREYEPEGKQRVYSQLYSFIRSLYKRNALVF